MPDSQMNFRIDADVRERFKEKALRNGTNANRLLMQWIEDYLADDDLNSPSIGDIESIDKMITERMAEFETRIEAKVNERVDAVLGESNA